MKYKKPAPLHKRTAITTSDQSTLDEWLVKRLKEKLDRCSIISKERDISLVIYQHTIDELNDVAEEEMATLAGKYVIVQIFAYGGFIPPVFRRQMVFTVEEFALWVLSRSSELLRECAENLDDIK